MAIDTATKRFSMMGFGDPIVQLVVPSGSITVGDRATLIDLYSGIALDSPLVTPDLYVEAYGLIDSATIAKLGLISDADTAVEGEITDAETAVAGEITDTVSVAGFINGETTPILGDID